ncbi:unnamed protein product [Polarella glacialis]|uniref:EamA domain-containing protein n=1 Tax=Polarella glacialis TaxID=89957 RepID=A0A813JTV9_POLGL|nr:unnamed protein product [Polarella glacialis]
MAADKKTSGTLTVFYVVAMLVTGTLNTLTTKIQFTLTSTGLDGAEETFRKPWFGTFNMLFAMSMVLGVQRLFMALLSLCRGKQAMQSAAGPLLQRLPTQSEKSYRQKVLMVAYPAAFDLVATALCCIGIMYIPASVWQMLRGATIVFSVLFSIVFLDRQLNCYHWVGIVLCTVGIMVIGCASVLGSAASSGEHAQDLHLVIFGMVLTLLGQVTQAAQVIAEEYLMKDVDLPAVEIVGFEGLWGLLMMVLIVYPALWLLPGSDHGHLEDPVDTYALVSNSQHLQCCVVLYLISCGTFNLAGIAVTGALSGIHRMMLDASRTMVIWAFCLFIHYRVDPRSPFGEAWTDHSLLQLGGFFVLIVGQAIYGEFIRIPGLKYPPPNLMEDMYMPSPAAAMHMASPLPPRRDGGDAHMPSPAAAMHIEDT